MKKIIIIILCLIGVAGIVAYQKHWIGHSGGGERGIQYTCPMHPQIILDHSGSCPICGMTLRPIAGSGEAQPKHAHPDGSFLLTPERRQSIGMKTAPVEKKMLRKEAKLPGKIAYDQELYVTEKEFTEGLKTGATSELLKTIETKMKRLGISDEELKTLRATKKAEESLVTPSDSETWIYVTVYESDLGWITPGVAAVISLPQDHHQVWNGIVRQVTPVLDAATRTATARVWIIPSPLEGEGGVRGALRPEVYVDVMLSKEMGEGLAIPSDAVIDTGMRQIVFVDLGEGYLEPRAVTLGSKAGEETSVVAGLKEGEKVVTSAQFLIDSESQIQMALQQFGEPMKGHSH